MMGLFAMTLMRESAPVRSGLAAVSQTS
jgi:hypothetical protein